MALLFSIRRLFGVGSLFSVSRLFGVSRLLSVGRLLRPRLGFLGLRPWRAGRIFLLDPRRTRRTFWPLGRARLVQIRRCFRQLGHLQIAVDFGFRREPVRQSRQNLHISPVGLDPDRTDAVLGDARRVADFRQQPARLGPVSVTHRQFEPDRRPKFGPVARRVRCGRCQSVRQNFGCRTALAPQPDEGSGDMASPVVVDQGLGQIGVVARRLGQSRVVQQALIVTRLHILGGRRLDPLGDNLGALQQPLSLLEFCRRQHQRRNPLAARPAGPARPVQQRLRRARQIGMDHQFQPRQVQAPRRHIGRNAHPCAAIAQSLQRVGAFGLRQLTRQSHRLKPPVGHAGKQVVHIGPGLAEDDRGAGLVISQKVKDRMFAVAHGHRNCLIFNIGVLGLFRLHFDAQGVLLISPRQSLDLARHRGRKHQGAAFGRARAQNERQIFLKPQIEHLIGFVQHHGADLVQLQRAAFDMVAQPPRCSHHHMHATVQHPPFGAVVHAADASCNLGGGTFIQPLKLPRDLQRQLPRGRDDQGGRDIGEQQLLRPAQQFGRYRQPKGHGLARPGLG